MTVLGPELEKFSARDRAMMGLPDSEEGSTEPVAQDVADIKKPTSKLAPDVQRLFDEIGLDRILGTTELFDRYGYKPPEAPRQTREALDLRMSAAVQQEIVAALSPDVSQHLAMSREDRYQHSKFVTTPLVKDIEALSYVRESGDADKTQVSVSLQRRDPARKSDRNYTPERIASFFCYRDAESSQWELAHRLVNNKFRGQGIGQEMLGLMERTIHEEATRTGEPQEMLIPARQFEVINFALHNGYAPKSDEDHERLKKILSGDDTEFTVASPTGYRTDGGTLAGYLVDRKKLAAWQSEKFEENEEGLMMTKHDWKSPADVPIEAEDEPEIVFAQRVYGESRENDQAWGREEITASK